MNHAVWAAMQPLQDLKVLDEMLPDLVDEEDLKVYSLITNAKHEVMEQSWFQEIVSEGGVLTAIGLGMLMIPEPVVYGVGFYFGGPVGGTVAMIVVNVIGIGLIAIDILL